MKTFPAGFANEIDKKTGLAPLWLLKMTVGGVDYYLSDTAFTIPVWNGGVTALPWVSSWGQIQEGITGQLGELRVADLSVDIIIDQAAAPNMETLAETDGIEQSPVSLYLWLAGLDAATDPPQEFGRFHVREVEIPDETTVRLDLEDETIRLRGKVGTKITRTDYPDADPDDVGKVIPIIFGSVQRLPALAADAGLQTSLPANLSATATDFDLSDGTGWAVGKVFQVDEEQCYVSGIVGDTVTVTRGYNTTVPVIHLKGAIVWEVKAEFGYLVADHAVDSIPKVRGRVGEAEVDITAVASRYLGSGSSALVTAGQVGGQHPDYPGKACVTLAGYITAAQAVELLLTDGIDVDDAIAIVDTIAVNDSISVSDTIGVSDGISVSNGSHGHAASNLTQSIAPDSCELVSGDIITSPDDEGYNACDGNYSSGTLTGANGAVLRYRRSAAAGWGGTPVRIRACIQLANNAYASGTLSMHVLSQTTQSVTAYHDRTTYKTGWVNLTSWSSLLAATTYLEWNKGSGQSLPKELWLEIEYDPSPPSVGTIVSKSGTASKTGSASKSGAASKSGDVSKTGTASKTGTVTLSGNSTANTLVGDSVLCDVVRSVTIPEVFDTLLALGGYGATVVSGSIPAGYAIDGAITEYRSLIEWLDTLAFQCRSYFRMYLGQGRLIVRPDTLTSNKTIPAVRLSGGRKVHSRRKVPYSEIINRINLLYDRDWSMSSGDNAYRGLAEDSDAASITVYGDCERPELFRFDFVRDQAMAESLRDFYLDRHKDRLWQHAFEVFLDHAELEFADTVTLGFASNQVGEVQQSRFAPGDINKMDSIELVVLV